MAKSTRSQVVIMVVGLVTVSLLLLGAMHRVMVPPALLAKDVEDLKAYRVEHTAWSDRTLNALIKSDRELLEGQDAIYAEMLEFRHQFALYLARIGHEDLAGNVGPPRSLAGRVRIK